MPDPLEQTIPKDLSELVRKYTEVNNEEMPQSIGQSKADASEPISMGSGEIPLPARSAPKNSLDAKKMTFRRVTTDDPTLNPDPKTYPEDSYFQINLQEAEKINVYKFSTEVSESEYRIMAGDNENGGDYAESY